jgi:Ca2+-binding EF-hand superfamily protein
MRKYLFAAVGFAALAGAAGLALAQEGAPREHRGVFSADANNDGVVTRAEFDAGQTALFARIDANNDGQLTREEGRAQRAMHRGGRRGHGGHGMRGADANNDGNITREEFLARPIAMFDRLDENDDGVISASERPQRGERGEHGPRGERGDRPDRDTNNDGQISRAEFQAAGAAMFQRLDANNDGRVTREEAQAARGHRGGRQAQ